MHFNNKNKTLTCLWSRIILLPTQQNIERRLLNPLKKSSFSLNLNTCFKVK
ncbi:hypothetical protein HMPREF9444_02257 [Succinatimonas hippei YIT 12066]|uniref:Uncharacterized protein n=1 Tax=Succinatimonas hippei (strain DSM 22608 / JCM 16073 / KCTC 15190 / YIT 12066) TaxID=762983 RepID=E8LNA2_SUCHY|nr:hypothetical protein HMPREF9444_02257 [Succinatimonas hippei YIT 12066]